MLDKISSGRDLFKNISDEDLLNTEIIVKSELKIPLNIKSLIEHFLSEGYLNKPLEKKFEILKTVIERRRDSEFSHKFNC